MKRTDVPYGQLDKVPRVRVLLPDAGRGAPTRVYDHEESGASIMLPRFPANDRVLEHHLVGVRTALDNFGIAESKVFDAK